jgi:hypothetical protein
MGKQFQKNPNILVGNTSKFVGKKKSLQVKHAITLSVNLRSKIFDV